jgi:endo-1,4-beta-xylanase
MVSFTSLVVATTAIAGALALPADGRSSGELVQRSTPNGQGTNNGYFWQFCMLRPTWLSTLRMRLTSGQPPLAGSDGSGSVTYTNGNAGEYSVRWNNVGDFTAGKGWRNASDRTIKYSGSFNPGSNGYLAVYTWYVSSILHMACNSHPATHG